MTPAGRSPSFSLKSVQVGWWPVTATHHWRSGPRRPAKMVPSPAATNVRPNLRRYPISGRVSAAPHHLRPYVYDHDRSGELTTTSESWQAQVEGKPHISAHRTKRNALRARIGCWHMAHRFENRSEPLDRGMPHLWCDFNACGWGPEQDDDAFSVFAWNPVADQFDSFGLRNRCSL